MKRLAFIIPILVLTTSISCSSLKKNDVYSKEERMKMDALAVLRLQCKSDYLKLQIKDSIATTELKNESRKVNTQLLELKQKIGNRYFKTEEDIKDFNGLQEQYRNQMTTCQKLDEYILQKAEAEAESEAKEKENKK